MKVQSTDSRRGNELGFLGGTVEGSRGGGAAGDRHLHFVKVAGTHEALVLDRAEAPILFHVELVLLQLGVGGHARVAIAVRQLEHAGVERVEAGQGHELVLVAQLGQLFLEGGDRPLVKVAPPVEGRRAVVGQQLAGVLFVDALGKLARLADIGPRGFAPDHVGIRGIGQAAGNRVLDARR